MNVEESLRRFGLVPADDALPAIRELLAREAAAERAGNAREEDLALLCCVQLFSRGLLEDVLPIWDAKSAGFDLGSYLGIQLLCGAGLEETKRFLRATSTPVARDAFARIQACEKAGDFEGFSPAAHLAEWRDYFGAR